MSRDRMSPQRGYANIAKLPRGPNGRCFCRQCGEEVPKGSRTFCSQECVDAWKIKTNPGHVRDLVFKRDKGICRQCGLDTVALARGLKLLELLSNNLYESRMAIPELSLQIQKIRRMLKISCRKSLWDADHIVEVVNGGGECGLDGYQTLCCWCHRAKPVKRV